MVAFIARRIWFLFASLVAVIVFAFALVHLIPGDPVVIMAGERGVDPARHQQLMVAMGLDRPYYQQFAHYVGGLLGGDMGVSIVTKSPVASEYFSLLPATVELTLCAVVLAVGLGLPLGVVAAVRRGSTWDYCTTSASLVGYSMPIFWWGLLLIGFSSVSMGWTPISGRLSSTLWVDQVSGFMLIDTLLSGETGAFGDAVAHLILPSIVLATIPLATIMRITRSSMLEVLGEGYVLAARAKGLSPLRVALVHALRNALVPVITVIGSQVGLMFSGAVLTETVFAWPGVGKWLVDSISRRDYPAVQGGIMMTAVLIIMVNFSVDMLYAVIDPRIRARSGVSK